MYDTIKSKATENHLKVMRKVRLNGRVDAVTKISPPSSTKSETFLSKFGLVAFSSCSGFCK